MNGCAILTSNAKGQPTSKDMIDVLTPECDESVKMKRQLQMCEPSEDDGRVILLTLSYVPYRIIKDYIGFVDIHLLREMPRTIEAEKCSLRLIRIIEEVHQLLKSKVLSLGGNALVGYKIINLAIERDINNLSRVNISISGTAVKYE